MLKKKYKRYFKDSKKSNSITFCLTVITIIIGSIFIYLGITFKEKPVSIYNYTVAKDADYNILLNPNIFYDTDVLPSNRLLCF